MRYMITNRKLRNGKFGNDNEPDGKLHYLLSEREKPSQGDFK